MKQIQLLAAALLGSAITFIAQPSLYATFAAAPTPCPAVKAAPTAKPTLTPTPSPGDIGKTKTLRDAKITLVNVEFGKNYGGAPKAGNILVAMELVIESGADTGVSANPLYGTISDSEGYGYRSSTFYEHEPTLQAQNDIPKGRKARGWITLEIPKTAKGLIFRYEDGGFNSDFVEFDLGR